MSEKLDAESVFNAILWATEDQSGALVSFFRWYARLGLRLIGRPAFPRPDATSGEGSAPPASTGEPT